MRTPQRRFEPSVIARLFAQPYRFQFFQAVRMLELWLKRNGLPREGAVASFLRFQNSTSLGFPASQLEAMAPDPRPEGYAAQAGEALDGAALSEALRRGEIKYIRITPAFMGFLGTAGSLPAHYTERIAAHALYERDDGPRAFLDAFSTRTLALFYEAWRKYRLELQYAVDGQDRFLPLLLSLAGVGNHTLRHRLSEGGEGVLDESVGYFAAAMRQRPASAALVGKVLSDYFGEPITVTQFIGRWYDVPHAQQSTLGGANAGLGISALVGARVWQRDLRMRLTIGPLDRAGFEAFLPGGLAARALGRMLSMFTGLTLEYEVHVVLRAPDVDGVTLNEERVGGRLGWDSFLSTRPETRDRDDLRYELATV